MIIQDTLTDYIFLIPCTSYITAKDVIEMWKQKVAPIVGLPHALISDQDPLFMSREFQEWLRTNGIEYKASSTYHPQTDGQSQRKNKTIIPMFIAEQAQGVNWVKAAPKIQTQVNARISEPRKNSPLFLIHRFNPKLAAAPRPHPISIYVSSTKLHYQLGKNLIEAKLTQITSANKNRRPAIPYDKGELVMVSTKNFPSHFNTNKLYYPWIGPVPVTKANNTRQTYTLDLLDYPELSKIIPTFHTSLIKPYQPNDDNKFPTRKLEQPGPVREGRYEVEKVVEFRTKPKTRKRQYKVRWKGYNKSKD